MFDDAVQQKMAADERWGQFANPFDRPDYIMGYLLNRVIDHRGQPTTVDDYLTIARDLYDLKWAAEVSEILR